VYSVSFITYSVSNHDHTHCDKTSTLTLLFAMLHRFMYYFVYFSGSFHIAYSDWAGTQPGSEMVSFLQLTSCRLSFITTGPSVSPKHPVNMFLLCICQDKKKSIVQSDQESQIHSTHWCTGPLKESRVTFRATENILSLDCPFRD